MKKKIALVPDLETLRLIWPILPKDLARVEEGDDDYVYDAASTATDDDNLVIKPAEKLTTQPGRWLKRRLAAADLSPEMLAGVQPGQRAINVLRVASDVVHEQTVTIGDDVYEIEIVNTDSTDDTDNGDFDSEDSPLEIAAADYPGTTWAAGLLIRVENEIMRVASVSGGVVTLLRGQSGTTIAAHADAENIYKGGGVTAGRIAVGLVTTLTPAAFSPALVADINEHGTEEVTAVDVSENEVLITADAVGAVVLACAETLGGANNAWAAAAMYGGKASGLVKLSIQKRVPKAVEIALGTMQFHFDFAPTVMAVLVNITATPGVAKPWDGTVEVLENLVTLVDGGSENLEATDTVTLVVSQ